MIRKVRNCCETCENLVCVATTIGQLQHTEYLKPTFLDTFKWAIRPVFPETVTIVFLAASDISSLSYQLLFTSAKLFFLFVFYIGFQVFVVSWACLFYSEGVFGVDRIYCINSSMHTRNYFCQ